MVNTNLSLSLKKRRKLWVHSCKGSHTTPIKSILLQSRKKAPLYRVRQPPNECVRLTLSISISNSSRSSRNHLTKPLIGLLLLNLIREVRLWLRWKKYAATCKCCMKQQKWRNSAGWLLARHNLMTAQSLHLWIRRGLTAKTNSNLWLLIETS